MIYVILAHNSPESLRKLMLRLKNKENHFVIHIDKNFNIGSFIKATADFENCYYTNKRYSSYWGSFGMVEATLHAFDFIRQHLRKRQRIVLLSGSDYPIKNNKFINNYLKSHKDTIFIEHEAIPRKWWNDGGRERFPIYDEIKNKLKLYGGSQWFSIPPKALTVIFRFLKLNPEFFEYFKHVQIPDESFFQTLFLNCDHHYIQENLKNLNLHHIKWDHPYLHPRTLTVEYYKQLKKSKNLFARKFDLEYSDELYNKLDKLEVNTSGNKITKSAIIFLTDKSANQIRSKYEKLKKESGKLDIFKVATEARADDGADNTLLYKHAYSKKMGYTPFVHDNIIPGSTYFSLLYFFNRYKDYDYYWLVEDDVWYNGDWHKFFSRFEKNGADLIGAYINSYSDAPHWEWWNSLKTKRTINNEYKKRVFYPVCRLSFDALKFLDQRLKEGDYGHGEVLVPTLLHLAGFSLYDLTVKDRFVINSSDWCVGNNNNGTYRYRPNISLEEIKGEYLFHPVKKDVLPLIEI